MILYNCHTEGDQYRITKFNDGEPESSYICSPTECECPAGHRPSCRHRQMLPQMLAHRIQDSMWFMDWDRSGAIVDFQGGSKRLYDQLATAQQTLDVLAVLPAEEDTLPAPQRASWRRL